MNAVLALTARIVAMSALVLDKLQAPFALGLRLWVSWQFFKSGLVKAGSWENTLFLFREEYHVPLLPSSLAAVVGTASELVFPVLLALGLAGRLAALGLSAVNVMAVVSYAYVLFGEGFEAALGQHYLWGTVLAVLAIYGPGAWSVDRALIGRRQRRDAIRGAGAVPV